MHKLSQGPVDREKTIVTFRRDSKIITSTIDENLIESFGQIYSGQISINNLFSHSQCSNGVEGCTSMQIDQLKL